LEEAGLLASLLFVLFQMYRVCTYRGVSQKWETVTVKDTKEAAEKFLLLLSKVRPDFSSKVFSNA
jgi:hypothetical protein